MIIKQSDGTAATLHNSEMIAKKMGHNFISPEHLLLAIATYDINSALQALRLMGVSADDVQKAMNYVLKKASPLLKSKNSNEVTQPKRMASTERIIRAMELEAKAMGLAEAHTAHILLGILRCRHSRACQFLEENNIQYDALRDSIIDIFGITKDVLDSDDDDTPSFGDDDNIDGPFDNKDNSRRTSSFSKSNQSNIANSDTPILNTFGIDLTKAAEDGRLDPVIGRDKEIERIAQVLTRRKKNNPILIGEPGVGKSAIAEGLALRIFEKKVPILLQDKRLIMLDLTQMIAGTKYRGQFEERIKVLLNEVRKNPNIILFIDEIHTIMGAGGTTGSLDAANMLKPALARGEMQCIGATTLDEFRKNIEKDGALERRFQKVMVEPTSHADTIEILRQIKSKYEDHHNVTYTDEALEACVTLTERYMNERQLPDKAIDALDEAGSRVHIANIVVPKSITELEEEIEELNTKKKNAVSAQNFELAASFRDKTRELEAQLTAAKNKWQEDLTQHREVVTADKVADVVALMTGIPVQRVAQAEGERLLEMGAELKRNIIGQDDAIDKIVKAILRNRAGLKDPNRPIGSFVFLGPTGVGKTHLAQVLAKYLFDSTDALIRIDMSEYMEKFSVSRLIGAPPGYVGYDEGGMLTEKVRRKPYSVVLLDEIEKAHPDMFNLMLQVLDEGILTDSMGRKIDFKNTIIIMTSNIGSRELNDFGKGVGFGMSTSQPSQDRQTSIIQKALRKAFAPEFLNRIDDVIMFNELSRDNIMKIIDVELRGLLKRVENLGFTLELTDAAKTFIADKSYDPQYGARPLRRSIQKYVEDELAEQIIEARISKCQKIKADHLPDTDKLTFTMA